MKHISILRLLTAAGSVLSTLALLDLGGVAPLFGVEAARVLLAAGPASLALKEVVVVIGDLLDDGTPNKSFRIGLLLLLLALPLLLLLPSCSTPPQVTGTLATKDGQVTVTPEGRIVVVVEPRTAK